MKSNKNAGRLLELKTLLITKQNDLRVLNDRIKECIENKLSDDTFFELVSKKNSLHLDIDCVETQILNVKSKKNQYGDVVQERSVRNWIND